jgi:preprotein translocase SecE subunit
MKKLSQFFKGVSSELRKVSWISRKQLFNSFFSTIAFLAILSIFFVVLDYLISLI